MASLSNLQSSLSTSFSTLSQRERRMVATAGVALAVFIVFMVTMSFSSKANSIRSRTEQKIARLTEVQELAAGYREQKAAQDALERQLAASNVRLVTMLTEKAQKLGLEQPSISPRPDVPLDNPKIVESAVELTLTDVKLNRLVDYVTAVEEGPAIVKVRYMRLEPRVASETVTAWLTIYTYHLK